MTKRIFTQKELPQKSDNWIAKRKQYIGASEMSVLTSDMPPMFDTAFNLFERKLGRQPPKEYNSAMVRGVALEDEAIEYIQRYLTNLEGKKTKLKPIVAVDFSDNLICSYDAVDLRRKIFVEVKCQSEKNFVKTVKTGMPSYYRAQVMSQACVAYAHWKIKRGFFCSYYPEPVEIRQRINHKIVKWETQLACIPVYYDVEYCKYLTRLTKSFKNMLDEGVWNPYWDIV